MLVETLKMLHYFGKHLKVRSCQIRTTQMTRKNLSIPSVPRGSLWCDQCVVRHYNAKTTLPSKMASLSLVSMPWWQLAPWVKSTKITLPKSQNMVTIALPILWPWFFFFTKVTGHFISGILLVHRPLELMLDFHRLDSVQTALLPLSTCSAWLPSLDSFDKQMCFAWMDKQASHLVAQITF